MLTLQFNKSDKQMIDFVENNLGNYKIYYSDSFDGIELLVTVLLSVITEVVLTELIQMVKANKTERRIMANGEKIEIDNLNERDTYNFIINNIEININEKEDNQ